MLLLADHEHETIILETSDGPIEIRLSGLGTGQARIGIEAPGTVRIIRRPLFGENAPLPAPVDDRRADGSPVEGEVPWWHHPDDLATLPAAGAQRDEVVAGDWDDDWPE